MTGVGGFGTGYSGLPNYYSLYASAGNWGGSPQISDTGNVYITPVSGAIGFPSGFQFSATVGYIDNPQFSADQFLPAWGGQVCGFVPEGVALLIHQVLAPQVSLAWGHRKRELIGDIL